MKFQHKRSNQLGRVDRNAAPAAKEPTPDKTEYGELAVNYNSEDPVLFIKDSLDNILIKLFVHFLWFFICRYFYELDNLPQLDLNEDILIKKRLLIFCLKISE